MLATYVNDELLAVYRYFRSLSVETPFLTARDNLILLFEQVVVHLVIQFSSNLLCFCLRGQQQQLCGLYWAKFVLLSWSQNRLQYSQLHMSKNAAHGGRRDRTLPPSSGTMKSAKKDLKSEEANVIASPPKNSDLMRNLRIRFVRMNGILFTRTR